jgi:hypothetical protein
MLSCGMFYFLNFGEQWSTHILCVCVCVSACVRARAWPTLPLLSEGCAMQLCNCEIK